MFSYEPNDPKHRSWVDVNPASDFPIQNLPFGVFQAEDRGPRVGVAIGELIADLFELRELGYLRSVPDGLFAARSLNPLLRAGREVWREVRSQVSQLLHAGNGELRDRAEHRTRALVRQSEARMLLPVEAGDFVDFYSSLEHAVNVGRLFRPDNPLLPNWRCLPVGYHGRTSTLVPSGTPVRRPRGQVRVSAESVDWVPARKLDFELEVGWIVGRDSEMGSRIPAGEAEEFIFGLVLVNDWSARDIQQWEYQPLGPFLGKSFATSVSPWVVTLDALEPFRVEGPRQEPPPLPYLQAEGKGNFDLQLEVSLLPGGGAEPSVVCRTNFRHIYWSMRQQLTHLTSNGACVRAGDLCASGTVSGSEPGSFGSLLELTRNGAVPLTLTGGERRTFLEDHDTVIMHGCGLREGLRIGFGPLAAAILPAL